MGPDAMIFIFWMLSFKPIFSLSSFTFIKRLFSSSSHSAIRVVLHIWGYWYFSRQSWFQLVLLPAQHFSWGTVVPLYTEEQISSLSLSLPCEDIRRVFPATRKSVLIWHQIYKSLDFGLLAFRTVRTMGICCSRPPVCGILLQQYKLTTLNSFLPSIPAACLAPPPNRSTNITF